MSPPSLRLIGQSGKIGLLSDAELKLVNVSCDGSGVVFDVIYENVTDRFTCDTAGNYSSDTNQLVCRDGPRAMRLSDYFSEYPLSFKTDDNTVYSGNEVLRGNISFERYDNNRISSVDWKSENTDIRKETGRAKNGKCTVQETIKRLLSDNTSYTHIIFDHGTGEIADFITFGAEESIIKVSLFHCKAMKGKTYNSNVSDIYEVAQQAVKCTVWLKSKISLLSKIQSRLKNANHKFIRGDNKALKELLESTRSMEVTVYIVQPGISRTAPMQETISRVLSAATFYIKYSGRVKELKVIGSV